MLVFEVHVLDVPLSQHTEIESTDVESSKTCRRVALEGQEWALLI